MARALVFNAQLGSFVTVDEERNSSHSNGTIWRTRSSSRGDLKTAAAGINAAGTSLQ